MDYCTSYLDKLSYPRTTYLDFTRYKGTTFSRTTFPIGTYRAFFGSFSPPAGGKIVQNPFQNYTKYFGKSIWPILGIKELTMLAFIVLTNILQIQ